MDIIAIHFEKVIKWKFTATASILVLFYFLLMRGDMRWESPVSREAMQIYNTVNWLKLETLVLLNTFLWYYSKLFIENIYKHITKKMVQQLKTLNEMIVYLGLWHIGARWREIDEGSMWETSRLEWRRW